MLHPHNAVAPEILLLTKFPEVPLPPKLGEEINPGNFPLRSLAVPLDVEEEEVMSHLLALSRAVPPRPVTDRKSAVSCPPELPAAF